MEIREKYFKAHEIEFVDSLIPVLYKAGLVNNAKRMSECGNKFNALECFNHIRHYNRGLNGIQKFRFPYCCELRICPRYCAKWANRLRYQINGILKHVNKSKTHKFVFLTLTKKVNGKIDLNPSTLKKFNKNVRKLINELYPKKSGCGAIAVMEIGKRFNIHAHILIYGSYISQRYISKKWLKITGDSKIIFIEAVKDYKTICNYLLKYIYKPVAFNELENYAEYLIGIKGVRRLHRYGIFYGYKIELEKLIKCPYCGDKLRYVGEVELKDIDLIPDYWEVVNVEVESVN